MKIRQSWDHLIHGNSYSDKMASVYWDGALNGFLRDWLLYCHQWPWNFTTMAVLVKPLSHQGGVLTATARRARKTQNAELRAVKSPRAPRDRRGIAVASPLDAVGSPRTPCHGAHFVHAQSARRGSAFPRRSEWAPCERRGFAAATQ